mgnify:FL=1
MKARKIAFLLVLSLGLLWFTENFPVYRYFEPQSTGWTLWMSYAKDLIQPFAFYFFLCIGEKWLKTWRSRALVAFGLPTLMEFAQDLYYRIWAGYQHTLVYFGAFDPLDLLMYAIGVALAVLVERQVFAKIFKFWE